MAVSTDPTPTGDEPGDAAARGLSRRTFLGFVVAGPTLITAVKWFGPGATVANAQTVPSIGPQLAEQYDLIDFLRDADAPTANMIEVVINEDGTVSFDMHRTEVGQGLSTAIAMVIGEELDISIEKVNITLADARPELLYNQLTGGSNSIFTIYDPVRLAAAIARQRLLDAAAIALGTGGQRLSIVDGVIRAPDGSSIGFGELARDAAALITEQVDAEPKSGDFAVVGQPTNRIDARSMVTGERKYTLDLDIPDALPTMMVRPPTILGTPATINNQAAILAMPGVTDVAMIESGVAIRARTFGHCIDAVRMADVTWNDGPAKGLSDQDVRDALVAAEIPQIIPDLSPLGALLGDAAPVVKDYSFDFAFKPNCPLETNPSIASVDNDAQTAEIWAPFKTPVIALQDIASALGFPEGNVTCHVIQAGGSFGRDLFWDASRESALISQAMGKPVKLSWHRTDDFRQGRSHPACRSSIRVAHTADDILAYAQHHTSVNTDFGHGLGEILTARADELPGGLGGVAFSQSIFFLTQYVPYNFGVVEQLLSETLPGPGEIETNIFRTGSMRNIYSPDVVTARELVVDQIVADMGKDPLEFRLAALKDERSRAVLQKVADEGDWGRAMPDGTAQGLGFHSEYKGRAACLVEIDARPQTLTRVVNGVEYAYTGPRVTKAIYAVDVGLAINPTGLKAQMLGGMMDGIANALTFGLHLDDGAYAEDSWEHAYYTRQWNVPPEIEVFVIQTSSSPGGAGEFGVAASMAATACAYARATGTMPTQFPINHFEPLAETIVGRGEIPQSPSFGPNVPGR